MKDLVHPEVNSVVFEYTRFLDASFLPLSFEFIAHAGLLLIAGLILIYIGYWIKGVLGSVLVLVIGAAAFLYQHGFLRF